jgi:hypothetical protein
MTPKERMEKLFEEEFQPTVNDLPNSEMYEERWKAAIEKAITAAVEEEREACAKIAESYKSYQDRCASKATSEAVQGFHERLSVESGAIAEQIRFRTDS